MTAAPLLVELFVEELPPKSLRVLSEAFADGLAASLRAQGLLRQDDAADNGVNAGNGSGAIAYATPRRLAVLVRAVLLQAPDARLLHKLMPVAIGLGADGTATPALLKKLAQLGLPADAVHRVQRVTEGKAEMLRIEADQPGIHLAAGLQKALDQTLAALPIPTVMQYQLADGWSNVRFVRPAHGLVALHGDEVVPCGVLGLQSGRRTHGHRFEAPVDPVELRTAAGYAAQMLAEGAVQVDLQARRADIAAQLQRAAAAEGLTPIDDPALLDEVTALVERPNVLRCRFDPAFLGVPPECLVLTMKANQRYFPLLDAAGSLTNQFLVVANVSPADPSAVIEGNERVVRPRLADAQFFYDQDRKRSLDDRVPELGKVVYHRELGTQGERSARVERIAAAIASSWAPGDAALAAESALAARLAKADLLTGMVGEFPELQGVMGRYYALHDNVAAPVAQAIEDHYRPRHAGDSLPQGRVGVVLALADKLETLCSLFGIGQAPTGDKDPYALRRNALGVVRLLVEKAVPLSLDALLKIAAPTPAARPTAAEDAAPASAIAGPILATSATTSTPAPAPASRPVADFILDRARGYFAEQGMAPRSVDAVLSAMGTSTVLSALLPIAREAVAFSQLPEGQALADANKRIKNILRKSGAEVPIGVSPRRLYAAPDAALFRQAEEIGLWVALQEHGEAGLQAHVAHRYADALRALIPLAAPVTRFFDEVLVNADDPAIRANRLALLQQAYAYMNLVADLGLMAG